VKVISISTPCDACMGTGNVKAHVACLACAGTGRLTHMRKSDPAEEEDRRRPINAYHGWFNIREPSDRVDEQPVCHRPKKRRTPKSAARFLTLADLESGLGDAPGQKR